VRFLLVRSLTNRGITYGLTYSRALNTFFCIALSFLLGISMSGCFMRDDTVVEKSRSLPAPPIDAKKYAVTYQHKGDKTDKALSNTLYQLPSASVITGENREQARYFMDVVSVFCGEDVCKVDKVRLFWDELGFYHHIELATGVELEKGEGVDFAPNDYIKLDEVLANRASGLKLLERYELVSNQSGGNTVDALSGATVSILKDDYITGAIWTCYTLWHFANGDMPTLIRNFTGNDYTLAQLKNYLAGNYSSKSFSASSQFNYQKFALEQLIRRNAIDKQTQALVINSAFKTTNNDNNKLFPLYIGYVELLPQALYFSAIVKLMSSDNNRLRWLALKSLERSKHTVPENFYLVLSQTLSAFNDYQQVHLLLTMLKTKQVFNEAIYQQLIGLLNHHNFIIARAVFWALNEQEVSVNIKQQLNNFEQKYQHKL